MTIVNQPAGNLLLLTSKPDNRRKEDLDATARPLHADFLAQTRVAYAMTEPTPTLRMYLLREMVVGGRAAFQMFMAWTANTRPVEERSFPLLNEAVRDSPAFLNMARAFEERVAQNLTEQFHTGSIHYGDLVTGSGPTQSSFGSTLRRETGRATGRSLPNLPTPYPPFDLRSDRVAKICMGSIQGIRIFLRDFTATSAPSEYSATIRYELLDHFGVDDDDCEISANGLHGTPGQIAMWVLQHHRHPGHMPWITVVTVERLIRGTLR